MITYFQCTLLNNWITFLDNFVILLSTPHFLTVELHTINDQGFILQIKNSYIIPLARPNSGTYNS